MLGTRPRQDTKIRPAVESQALEVLASFLFKIKLRTQGSFKGSTEGCSVKAEMLG